jgi:outer membrane protein OmpA-like peptidoglycan-associated protein
VPTASSTPATPVLDPVKNVQDTKVPAGGVPAGEGQVLVNGREVDVAIAPNRRSNPDGLVVSGGNFTMRIAGLNAEGSGLPLADDGALILQRSNLARTEGTGFQSNGPVQIYLMSTPRFLGTVMANPDGTFAGTVLLPADIKPGRHTLQSNGFTPDGKVRSVSVGVLLRDAAPAKLARAKAKVFFAPLSSELTAESKVALNAVARKVGSNTAATVVIGYVQGTSITTNDRTLSDERAQVVARYLKDRGVKGRFTVRGDGVAPEAGATARRVRVTITYRP